MDKDWIEKALAEASLTQSDKFREFGKECGTISENNKATIKGIILSAMLLDLRSKSMDASSLIRFAELIEEAISSGVYHTESTIPLLDGLMDKVDAMQKMRMLKYFPK